MATKPRLWLWAGLALAIIALARPQWGRLEEPVFDQSREILLAIDLSRSMLTPDIKPSRLERSKLLIQSLLERLAGERVGLAVFAGTAFLQSPLSADYEILREFLPALSPDFLPEGGSHYGALIETALQAFGTTTAADRFLVILSDGEATDEDWKGKLDELKKKDIRVLGLGVGTAGGGMIPDANGQFVKDERGAVVLSKLEAGTLQQLAQATGGVYRDASAWVDLAGMVDETIAAGRKGEFVEKRTVRLVERFQWPLAFGLWCLLMSLCYEFPVRPRPRTIALRAAQVAHAAPEQGAGSKEQALNPAAVSLILLLLLPFSLLPAPARAADAAPSPPASEPAAATAAPEPLPLVKIVSRLAGAGTHTARDWAELGRETVSWGSRLQSEQQPVLEGPVRDALAAVDLGTKIDAKATDWKKLREELEALLQKPDDDKQDKQDQQKQDEQQQDQEKQNQEKKSDQQKQQDKSNQQKSKSDQKDSAPQEQQPQDAQPPEPNPQGESAFGDMNKKEEPPPPPPPQSTQKVGGAPEKTDEPPPPLDPSLALPMQKLDQLRNQDSPAQLFQLMDGEKKPTKKTGKDW